MRVVEAVEGEVVAVCSWWARLLSSKVVLCNILPRLSSQTLTPYRLAPRTMSVIKLFGFFDGAFLNEAFPISINKYKYISNLKNLVKTKLRWALDGVDAAQLAVTTFSARSGTPATSDFRP